MAEITAINNAPRGDATAAPATSGVGSQRPPLLRVGCVSFLNAKPLIHGFGQAAVGAAALDADASPTVSSRINPSTPAEVIYAVPSALLGMLEAETVDIALCPVIDQQRSRAALEILPVGGIGCRGKTLTVRLFSRVPFERVTHVHADTDSHTSVALLRVLLAERFGVTPELLPFDAPRRGDQTASSEPEAMLLIGDKIVAAPPNAEAYPYQLDLGEQWYEMTGLPFVFAAWMARVGHDLGDVPQQLNATRVRNSGDVAGLVDRYAAAHGWPSDLAMRYLGEWLRYGIEAEQLEAIECFYEKAAKVGAIESRTPLLVRRG